MDCMTVCCRKYAPRQYVKVHFEEGQFIKDIQQAVHIFLQVNVKYAWIVQWCVFGIRKANVKFSYCCKVKTQIQTAFQLGRETVNITPKRIRLSSFRVRFPTMDWIGIPDAVDSSLHKQGKGKVRHLYSLSIQIRLQSRRASVVRPDEFCQTKHLEDTKKYIQLQAVYGIMHDSNPTCICQIINPAPHKVVGAGFYIARMTTKTCLPSVCICRQIHPGKLKTPEGILVFRV